MKNILYVIITMVVIPYVAHASEYKCYKTTCPSGYGSRSCGNSSACKTCAYGCYDVRTQSGEIIPGDYTVTSICSSCNPGYVLTEPSELAGNGEIGTIEGRECEVVRPFHTSCYPCPTNTESRGSTVTAANGATSYTQCYTPAGSSFSDSKGSGTYKTNCYYSE